ncbi:hypothetical protein TeGR_g8108, partial [Tetraparma gracilis]
MPSPKTKAFPVGGASNRRMKLMGFLVVSALVFLFNLQTQTAMLHTVADLQGEAVVGSGGPIRHKRDENTNTRPATKRKWTIRRSGKTHFKNLSPLAGVRKISTSTYADFAIAIPDSFFTNVPDRPPPERFVLQTMDDGFVEKRDRGMWRHVLSSNGYGVVGTDFEKMPHGRDGKTL